jgi:hypothetical protein
MLLWICTDTPSTVGRAETGGLVGILSQEITMIVNVAVVLGVVAVVVIYWVYAKRLTEKD